MKKLTIFLCIFVTSISAQTRTFRDTPDILLGLKKDRTASLTLTFADVDGDKDLDAIVANGCHWPQINEVFLDNGRENAPANRRAREFADGFFKLVFRKIRDLL